MSETIEMVVGEAKRLLYAYPERTQIEKIKYFIKRILRPNATLKDNLFSWPQAMLTMGLLETGEREYVEAFYQKYIEKGCPIENMDGCMHGMILLSLFETSSKQEKKAQYQNAVEKMYRYLIDQYEKNNNSIPYREHHPSYILVDEIGMVVPFLAKYGAVFQENKSIEMAIKLLNDYWECGMNALTGLPYHGYDSKSKMKYGIIGWGRAVGWFLWGIVDSLDYLPKEIQKIWRERAYQLVEKCIIYQRSDGGFSWQIQATEGHLDSSATVMIGIGVKFLLNKGISSAISGIEIEIEQQGNRKLKEALEKLILVSENCVKNGKVMDASAECIDFAQYPQAYGSYPWSVGPYLRLLARNH